MLINKQRQKLVEAINYFAANTNKCGKTKLFKLLYFMDFEHFKEIGRSVTGLEYFAWPKGPVPVALFEEFDKPKSDLSKKVQVRAVPVKRRAATMQLIQPVSDFNDEIFSKRELRILSDLANKYRDADSEEMVEKTHLENLPWHQIYEVNKDKQGNIPYDLALRKQDEVEMLEQVKDTEEMHNNYKG